MARPQQKGLVYFSFDVDFFNNRKIHRIIRACGSESVTIIISLLCVIYGHEGYYALRDDDLSFDIAEICGSSETKVIKTIKKALQVNFFSQKMYDKYNILTSIEIQARYLQGTTKRVDIHLIDEYRINANTEIIEKQVSGEEKPVSGEEKPVSDLSSTQSKVKDIKVKNIKEKNIKEKNASLLLPPHFSNNFLIVWERWKEYKRGMDNPYLTILSEQQQIIALEKFDEETAIAMINQSITAQWKGIFEIKKNDNLQTTLARPVKLSVLQQNMLNLKQSLDQ
jgi:hypothetical protein